MITAIENYDAAKDLPDGPRARGVQAAKSDRSPQQPDSYADFSISRLSMSDAPSPSRMDALQSTAIYPLHAIPSLEC
jgi:hypothetical protein